MITRLLFRYAGRLACLVTALALVGCGGGPGAQPEPKEIGDISLQQGEQVRTIPLSDKFSGSDLTYSATTSNRSVATVTVDNDADTLTVRAVGPGTATITVNAENSEGEAKQTFTVTVPQPPTPDPDPDPDPVEIPNIPSLARDTAETIPLGDKFSGENLTYTASSSNELVALVSVNQAILTVRAVGPGTATITVTATAQGSADQTQTFTVTVPQPVEAPTVIQGAQSTVTVAQGATSTITLSTVFTGTGLSFTASSSDTAVATVSESGGILTITGDSIGSATVTVTATNTAGTSPAHEIAVTVNPPATPPRQEGCSPGDFLTINRDTSKKCTLPAGQSLIYDDPSGKVSVDGPVRNNVWTITAHKKGISAVKINENATGTTKGTITVTVPNTPPKLKLNTATETFDVIFAGASLENLLGADVANNADDPIVTASSNPGASFEDEDPADLDDPATTEVETGQGLFRFTILSSPEEVLIDTDGGYVAVRESATTTGPFNKNLTNAAISMRAIILKTPSTDPYDILLYAHDGDNDPSDNPVTLRLQQQPPQTRTYAIEKSTDGKSYKTHKVGNRIGVNHTITVPVLLTGALGFGFVDSTHVGEVLKNRLLRDADAPTTSHTIGVNLCDPVEDAPTDWGKLSGAGNALGEGCWRVSAGSKAEIIRAGSTPPSFIWKLPSSRGVGDGSDVPVTITYYVRALSSPVAADTEIVEATPGTRTAYTHSSWKKTLTLDIHRCVDVDDCP